MYTINMEGLTESRRASITPPTVINNRTASRAVARTGRLLERMKTWGIMPESATVGSTVMRNAKSGVFFPEVTWRDQADKNRRTWLRVRPPLYPQDKAPASIQFVTGTCLFGRMGATMNLADGSRWPLVSNRLSLPSPIESISIRDELSFYELDTACRLSSVIRALTAPCTLPSGIFVHIPRPEYILVMFGHRRVTSDKWGMKGWLEAVERRGAQVGKFFTSLLARSHSGRLNIGSPLDAVLLPYLRDAISRDETPTPPEIVKVISASGGLLAELFAHWLKARGASREPDYYDLAHFGYVAGVAVNLVDSSLAVEVDNPSEEPIFRALSQILRAYKGADWGGNVMAIYPSEDPSWGSSFLHRLPAVNSGPGRILQQTLVDHYGLAAA